MRALILMIVMLFSINAFADERYMPNDAGGFLVITEEPCQIEGVSEHYPFMAYETNDQDDRREGCYGSPEVPTIAGNPEFQLIPLVNVFMYEEGNTNTATFDSRLFGIEKKRWEKYPIQAIRIE